MMSRRRNVPPERDVEPAMLSLAGLDDSIQQFGVEVDGCPF